MICKFCNKKMVFNKKTKCHLCLNHGNDIKVSKDSWRSPYVILFANKYEASIYVDGTILVDSLYYDKYGTVATPLPNIELKYPFTLESLKNKINMLVNFL